MIRREDDPVKREYLYYLMNDLGLLNDYDLNEIGISYEDYHNPSDEVLDRITDYRDKKNREN